MSRYLVKAAALLDKAAEANERDSARYSTNLRDERLKIAREYALLALIDKGLLPEPAVTDLYGRLARS